MDRIKVRQEKFKKGKEKMMSIAQESGEGQTLVQPEEDDDDEGRTKAARGLTVSFNCNKKDAVVQLREVKVNLVIDLLCWILLCF